MMSHDQKEFLSHSDLICFHAMKSFSRFIIVTARLIRTFIYLNLIPETFLFEAIEPFDLK